MPDGDPSGTVQGDVAVLVGDLLSADAPDGDRDDVAEALVQAGRDMMATTGIRRLRMDDVARRAGYGRATLYRRFATRDDLVWAVVTVEVDQALRHIGARLLALPTLQDQLVEAFAGAVEHARTNRVWRRLLEVEADLLLPFLTTGGHSALDVARQLLGQLLTRAQAEGEVPDLDAAMVVEVMVRTAHSMVLTSAGPVDVDDPVALRAFARADLVEPLLGQPRTRPAEPEEPTRP